MVKIAVRSYRDLLVWQKSVELAIGCYRAIKNFPVSELYGLTSQIQRSAVSVAANIAEGNGRKHLAEYLHHLSIARGSLMELETHLIIAARLSYLRSPKTLLEDTAEVGRMLNGLIAHLRRTSDVAPLPAPDP
jgi:four helix bundle protein